MARNLDLAAGAQGHGTGHAADLVDTVLAGRPT
jgi:3-carboxy-cis,cis-muconate cycloisomerase